MVPRTGVQVARHLGLVGLVEVLQAQAVTVGAATFNPLPLNCNINIFMHSYAISLQGVRQGHHCTTTLSRRSDRARSGATAPRRSSQPATDAHDRRLWASLDMRYCGGFFRRATSHYIAKSFDGSSGNPTCAGCASAVHL